MMPDDAKKKSIYRSYEEFKNRFYQSEQKEESLVPSQEGSASFGKELARILVQKTKEDASGS